MVPRINVIGSQKLKVPKDLIIKSSELLFLFLNHCKQKNEDAPLEFTIVFVTDNKIKEYNYRYRNKNVSTDVLSFCAEKENMLIDTGSFISEDAKYLGDILISPKVVMDNSIRFNVDYKEELIRTVVHGILHLLGYDHLAYLGEGKDEFFKLQEDFIIYARKQGLIQ